MPPIISVLHATLGRPHKAMAAMRLFHDSAEDPETVEYIFSVNEDDATRKELAEMVELAMKTLHFSKIYTIVSDVLGSAAAWNAAAMMSQGDLIVQGQDDLEPPERWDRLLLKKCESVYPISCWWDERFFLAVGDGYRKDALCCTAIMSRPYMAMEGHFLFPGYLSVFSDDEVTYRALRNERDDRSQVVRSPEIVFLHRHHYHDKAVPWDETYARENSSHAYAVGEKLFRDRNPRASTDGLKTW